VLSKFRIVPALMATVLLVAPMVMPAAAQDGEVAVTLHRGACFGSCPVYSVTIYTDGTVVFVGERFVEAEGTHTTTIEPEVVQQLVEGFEAAGYFEWEDEYTEMTVSDLPTIITSVTRDGETKQITRYTGDSNAPLELPYLETWIDMAAYTSQFTGTPLAFAGVQTSNAPVMTLERAPCFGFCPVYGVAVFADGTVVYLGIQHVAELGVRVANVDSSEVEFLAMETANFGYFGWDDAYTLQIITDQAYAITTLNWDNQYKQITRYDGDPNAPIGLVRFEDRIDRLVNVAQWVGTPE
jgi:hypothetical protein